MTKNIQQERLKITEFFRNFKEDSFAIWQFLEKHRNEIKTFIKSDGQNIDNITEFSLVLGILEGDWQEDLNQVQSILKNKDKQFKVKSGGEIVGTGKYEVLDIGWSEALITFLKNFRDPVGFQDNPPIINISDNVSINIFGDFGTGDWQQSVVASTISQNIKNLKPDYSIHLGDVYYSGNSDESLNYLMSLWPASEKGNFTLNSNHEMYDGGRGYFYTSLANPIFAAQKKNSYFALENSNWVIVGLDSAYFSDKKNLYMDGNINDTQINFLKQIALKNKKVMVLSHHNPLDNAGNNMLPIWNQVSDALGNCLKYWYFGHTHCAAIYQDINNVKFRLSGHSAVPFGNASDFANSSKVVWYEHTAPLINDCDGLRVQNGFSMIRLNNQNISEEFYGEDGQIHFKITII